MKTNYQPVQIEGKFGGKHIVSVDQFNRDDLDILFKITTHFRHRVHTHDSRLSQLCAGKIMAVLFFEASTRTDMSFQAAMRRLGGDVIAVSNGVNFSSMYKGENLPDTIRAVGCYADVIVLRHPEVGSSYEASYYLDRLNSGRGLSNPTTLISGGDGAGEHPTQALLDLYTIFDQMGSLDNITITLAGDLRYGRTVHSLAKLIAYYNADNVKLCFVSPSDLTMPETITKLVQARGVEVVETSDITSVISDTDVIYWTRIQEERFENIRHNFLKSLVSASHSMHPSLLEQAPKNAILMHPFPRKNEMMLHDILDEDPRAVYFEQMENGMFVRMALLAKVLCG